MPDQSTAATEHAILQEITAPLATLPDDAVPIAADPEFPVVLRGYDRLAVDAYVKKTSQLVAEMQATRSPEAAVRRALERVGEEVSGVLQRAHETAAQLTTQSRSEAEARLEAARREAVEIVASAEQRLRDLDAETDRIWEERRRIIDDARELAGQLTALAEEAAARFPLEEEETAVEADPEAVAEPGLEEEEEDEEEDEQELVPFDAEATAFDEEATEATAPDSPAPQPQPPLEPDAPTLRITRGPGPQPGFE